MSFVPEGYCLLKEALETISATLKIDDSEEKMVQWLYNKTLPSFGLLPNANKIEIPYNLWGHKDGQKAFKSGHFSASCNDKNDVTFHADVIHLDPFDSYQWGRSDIEIRVIIPIHDLEKLINESTGKPLRGHDSSVFNTLPKVKLAEEICNGLLNNKNIDPRKIRENDLDDYILTELKKRDPDSSQGINIGIVRDTIYHLLRDFHPSSSNKPPKMRKNRPTPKK